MSDERKRAEELLNHMRKTYEDHFEWDDAREHVLREILCLIQMRCKDCIFFDEKPVEGWGSCDNDDVFQGASDFICVKPTEKTLFRYSDGEQYGASFEVHENFGCVGFREKEKK